MKLLDSQFRHPSDAKSAALSTRCNLQRRPHAATVAHPETLEEGPFFESIIMSIISFYAKALNHLVTAIAADTAANQLTVENEGAG